MKKRVPVIVLATLALLVASFVPAAAVQFGEPDGDGHPFVGMVVFDVDGSPSHRCSGALLSPTVFLTAGHCTTDTDAARVWFESEVIDPFFPFSGGTAIDGTPHTHPDWDDFASFPDTNDVGVVVLDEEVILPEYAQLADVGALDALATRPGLQDIVGRIVGYGLQDALPPTIQADLERYVGVVKINNLNNSLTGEWNVQLSANAGEGHGGSGGACFGDSGGPFLPNALGENVVAAVGSFVLNLQCMGNGFYFRVDTQSAQDFINDFLD